ncbi:MAG: hypothetical protein ACFFCS_03455 [Candidatus Hodarchaeota archaeon]
MEDHSSTPVTDESAPKEDDKPSELLETWLAKEIMKILVVHAADHPRGMRLGDIAEEIGETMEDVLEMCEVLVSAGKLEQSPMDAGFSTIHRFNLKSISS